MRPRRTRAHVLRPCARARVCDWGRTHPAPIQCERVLSVWTAGGSARSRSARRRRSTRTSEHGTLRELRTWPTYAPFAIASVCEVLEIPAARITVVKSRDSRRRLLMVAKSTRGEHHVLVDTRDLRWMYHRAASWTSTSKIVSRWFDLSVSSAG